MKIAVIQFPGTNCERETHLALKRSQLTPINFFWNEPLCKIKNFSGYVIAGGFSYEDRIRSGLIASKSPLINALKQEAKSGKPILGICNGAQILVESGLVPANQNQDKLAALTHNQGKTLGFYNDYCTLTPFANHEHHAFTNQFKPGESITIPFAHAEGRFIIEKSTLKEMIQSETSMFQYADNPNGSDFNLAAISNKPGNVMAMMPHPERSINGQKVFDSMREYIKKHMTHFSFDAFRTTPQNKPLLPYKKSEKYQTLIIEAVIEDNGAKSLSLLLYQLGFKTRIKRYTFYEMQTAQDNSYLQKKLANSEMLFNSHKEKFIASPQIHKQAISYIVMDKTQAKSAQTLKVLQEKFAIDEIQALKQGTLYNIECLDDKKEYLKRQLIDNHLLFNPLSEDCYEYPL